MGPPSGDTGIFSSGTSFESGFKLILAAVTVELETGGVE